MSASSPRRLDSHLFKGESFGEEGFEELSKAEFRVGFRVLTPRCACLLFRGQETHSVIELLSKEFCEKDSRTLDVRAFAKLIEDFEVRFFELDWTPRVRMVLDED